MRSTAFGLLSGLVGWLVGLVGYMRSTESDYIHALHFESVTSNLVNNFIDLAR